MTNMRYASSRIKRFEQREKNLPELKNLVHNERIGDHPWGKLNLCLKGKENAKKFKKCVLWTELDKLKIVKEGERTTIVNPADDMTVHSSESMASSDFNFSRNSDPILKIPQLVSIFYTLFIIIL